MEELALFYKSFLQYSTNRLWLVFYETHNKKQGQPWIMDSFQQKLCQELLKRTTKLNHYS